MSWFMGNCRLYKPSFLGIFFHTSSPGDFAGGWIEARTPRTSFLTLAPLGAKSSLDPFVTEEQL